MKLLPAPKAVEGEVCTKGRQPSQYFRIIRSRDPETELERLTGLETLFESQTKKVIEGKVMKPSMSATKLIDKSMARLDAAIAESKRKEIQGN